MISAARLNRRITLHRQIETIDPNSREPVVTHNATEYATVWAALMGKAAVEKYVSDTIRAEFAAVWKIRFRTDVLVTDQIKHGSDVYEIKGVYPLGLKDELELVAVRFG